IRASYLALAAAAALYCANPVARAGNVLDIDMAGQNIGDNVPIDPATTPLPLNHFYSQGGYPDTPPYSGTALVQNVTGISQAAVMTTTQGGTGSNFLDTQFLVAAPIITFDFDINVLASPITGIPQDTASAPNGQAFVIQAFAYDSNRVWRFATTPTSATTGAFGMRNDTDGDLLLFGTYNLNEAHHISIAADYATDLVSVFLDNAPALTLPFVSPEPLNGGMEEFFIFQNGVEGVTNQVAIGNIESNAVPEPSSWILLSMGLCGLIGWRGARKG
ncbi:MAG TPA: PEP-CTERM sorting domain-containing protein, partial [Pirellulales bacterium]|nr:PEP-CTERM sorting domain-containing protein [Pirellulales bacterium]